MYFVVVRGRHLSPRKRPITTLSNMIDDLGGHFTTPDVQLPAPSQSSQSTAVSGPSIGIQSTSDPPLLKVDQCRVSKDDMIIAVMGPTGVGKSSFISVALGQEGAATAGHSLASCTREVRPFRCRHPGGGERNIVFVDTPGFDDTNIKDADILGSIAQWLKQTYENGITLTGVLYLHRISDNRMSGAPLRNLGMFRELCGKNCFRSVVLATTMWDDVDEDCGSQRQEELEQKYWKSMIKLGSRVHRFHSTKESAWDIIGQLPGVRQTLQIQKEMVDQRKSLPETSAGRTLFYWLADFIAHIRRLIEKWMGPGRHPENETGEASLAVEEKRRAAIQQLEQASAQLVVLDRRAEPSSAVGVIPNQLSRPSTPSTPSDTRTSSLYDLSRFDTTSSSGSSILGPTPSARNSELPEFRNTGLAATITALKIARDMANIAPLPGLKGATNMALTIVETVAAMKNAQGALVTVAYNAGRLVVAISEHARAGHMPYHVQQAVDDLIRELKSVQKLVKRVNSRARWQAQRFFLQPAEMQLAVQCNERIQFAVQIFEIKFALDIRQMLERVEERMSREKGLV